MNDKSLRVLEYNKIIEMLAGYAVNDITRGRVLEIKPVSDFYAVESMQSETDEALVCVLKYGAPDISRVGEVSSALKRIEVGGALGTAELLNVAKVLKCARVLRKYGGNMPPSLKEVARSAGGSNSPLPTSSTSPLKEGGNLFPSSRGMSA